MTRAPGPSDPALRAPTRGAPSLPRQPRLLLVYLGISLMVVTVHAWNVNYAEPESRWREGRHRAVVEGTGKAPYVYRVLVPVTADLARKVFGLDDPDEREIPYLALRFLFVFGALVFFHAFLAALLGATWALAGTLLLAALHPASFYFYWFQPASALDLWIWIVAAWWSLGPGSGWWLLPLVGLGALNRETVVFVPAIHLALRFGREPVRPLLLRTLSMGAVWVAIFLGLRWVLIGPRERVVGVAEVVQGNLDNPHWFGFWLCLFGGLWILPVIGWRDLPGEIRRLSLVMLPYLGLVAVYGRARELRLLLPLALFLIPAGLFVLKRELETAEATRASRVAASRRRLSGRDS